MSGIRRFWWLILIGLIAFTGLSIPKFRMRPSIGVDRHVQVEAEIALLRTLLGQYKGLNGFYPTTEQGLRALMEEPRTSPRPSRWYRVDMKFPKDPWQNDYVYRSPGTKNPDRYDLFSPGPDHIPDTADDDWGR